MDSSSFPLKWIIGILVVLLLLLVMFAIVGGWAKQVVP